MMKKKLFISLFGMTSIILSGCAFEFNYILPNNPFKGSSSSIEDYEDDIDDSGSYEIKIWCDQRIKELTTQQVNDFATASNGKYKIEFTVDTTGEDAAASSMIENVQAGADIFIFAQDQLSRLKTAGALSSFTGGIYNTVVKETDADGISAASLNGKLYALPFTSDNGYFMYYNKDVLGEDDVKDMATMCEKLHSKGKKLNYQVFSNGWYGASYFMATGCTSEWTIDPTTNKFSAFNDNYRENGIDACKGLLSLKKYKDAPYNLFSTKDVTDLKKGLGAIVSGIWDYELASSLLGDKLGCCELPSFTVEGKSIHLSSFKGYKLIGVKPTNDSKKLSVCKKIARFLTTKDAQLDRFERVKWAPTNKDALGLDKVQNHPAVSALLAQSKYAKPQLQTPSSWFGAVALIGTKLSGDPNGANNISACLQEYYDTLPSFLDD